jgi:hypothetical protein
LGVLGGEQALIDLRLRRGTSLKDIVIVAQHHPFACRKAAQAFVPGGSREPGTHAIGGIETIDVLEQAQPCHLRDIGRITLGQLEVPGNRPDESRVLVDQTLPRPSVSLSGAPDESRDVQGIIDFFPLGSHPISDR